MEKKIKINYNPSKKAQLGPWHGQCNTTLPLEKLVSLGVSI